MSSKIDNTVIYYILYHLIFIIYKEDVESKNNKERRKWVHDRIVQDLGIPLNTSFRLYGNTNSKKRLIRFFPKDETYKSWHDNQDLHERALISETEYPLTFGNALRSTLMKYLMMLSESTEYDPFEFLKSKLGAFSIDVEIGDVTDLFTVVDRIVKECEGNGLSGNPTLEISYNKKDTYYQMSFVINESEEIIMERLEQDEKECAIQLLNAMEEKDQVDSDENGRAVLGIYVDQKAVRYCLDYSGHRSYAEVSMPYDKKAVKQEDYDLLCFSIQRIFNLVCKKIEKNIVDLVITARGRVKNNKIVRSDHLKEYVLTDRTIKARLVYLLDIPDDRILLINDHQASIFADIKSSEELKNKIYCMYYLTLHGVGTTTLINAKLLEGYENGAGEIATIPYQIKGRKVIYEQAVALEYLILNLNKKGLEIKTEDDLVKYDFFMNVDDGIKKIVDQFASDVVFALLLQKHLFDFHVIYVCNRIFRNPYIFDLILNKFNQGLRVDAVHRGEEIIRITASDEPALDGAIQYIKLKKDRGDDESYRY